MAFLDPQYSLLPTKLHEALLTSPATRADCALHMINTGGLTLSQAAVENAIARIITDLAANLVLSTANYATLLSRHQAAAPSAALDVLKASGRRVIKAFLRQQLDREIAALQAEIDTLTQRKAAATAEYTALTPAQRNAIANLFAVANLHGVPALDALVAEKTAERTDLEARRDSLPS